ncbi:hypothetical protein AVEN_268995-1 [Araneus ventricosus]|uniref:Uncharacterized protein n=1 Tax=Araneus ventricosus TaxID=182803 RepID=A0A4Y2X258_ARAVE|nr:hypothetical protein AVEN_268995-1 [Araneus ventricosus]
MRIDQKKHIIAQISCVRAIVDFLTKWVDLLRNCDSLSLLPKRKTRLRSRPQHMRGSRHLTSLSFPLAVSSVLARLNASSLHGNLESMLLSYGSFL